MSFCPGCGRAVTPGDTRCQRCGANAVNVVTTLAPSDRDETRLSAVTAVHETEAGGPRDFVPGRLIAGRFRIVALLGRGGMGEVYRAEDLKLGQPVALKFLPAEFVTDARLQERLLKEVRVARDVSHPNVCRVYDVVEAGNDQFIAMEYIDGEDLASLLRRIGRLAPDKAADIARQLCAGLAAIHDKGLLHRDLKPANVMLDGRGRVRVTDFGLAVDAAVKSDVREIAGTPAYMAPEQLEGRQLSRQTDLYALGLILFELLTGRRFFEAGGAAALRSDRSDIDVVKRQASEATLDPVIERLVVRCLDPNPERRPESALQVAAALPGGDPLAAALAAGETPSPALVAAAGEGHTLSRQIALAALVTVMALVVPVAWWEARGSAFAHVQPPFSRDVLEFKAREMLKRLGYDDARMHSATSFEVEDGYKRREMELKPADRWKTLTAIPSPVTFWMRTSPRRLIPREFGAAAVSRVDPTPLLPGMKTVSLDSKGQLVALVVQPRDLGAAANPVSWATLFAEAGLDIAGFKEVPPATLPTAWGDARAAWVSLGSPQAPAGLLVEAAAFRGRPTLFKIAAAVPPAESATVERRFGTGAIVGVVAGLAVFLAMVLTTLHMARSNYRSGRADWRGASRVAAVFAVSHFAIRAMSVASPLQLVGVYSLNAAATSIGIGVLIWILYLALEPQIRRSWPEALVGWNRLLEGRVFDARVGADILSGVAIRIASAPLEIVASILSPSASVPGGLDTADWIGVMSARHAAATTLSVMTEAVLISLVILLVLSFAFLVTRRQQRTMVAFAVLFAGIGFAMGTSGTGSAFDGVVGAMHGGTEAVLVMFVLSRFGILALVSYMTAETLLSKVTTIHPSAWYSAPSWIAIAIVVAAAYYGYRQVMRAAPVNPAAAR